MIALLGTLLGFITAMVPEILGLLKVKQDNGHEYRMIKLQGELASQQHIYKLQELNLYADVAESRALNERVRVVGITWVDALAASVRPVITYAFFLLYATVKIVSVVSLMDPSLPWQQAMTFTQALIIVWNDEDTGLFGAVMAFWFGSRSMKQYREAKQGGATH